jgi:hypothetical protein
VRAELGGLKLSELQKKAKAFAEDIAREQDDRQCAELMELPPIYLLKQALRAVKNMEEKKPAAAAAKTESSDSDDSDDDDSDDGKEKKPAEAAATAAAAAAAAAAAETRTKFVDKLREGMEQLKPGFGVKGGRTVSLEWRQEVAAHIVAAAERLAVEPAISEDRIDAALDAPDAHAAMLQVRETPSWPRSRPTSAFCSCIPTGMHGQLTSFGPT